MANYAVRFVFADPAETQVQPCHRLERETLEGAKLEAAILYAVANFGTLPTAYMILRDGEIEVYRYPETNVVVLRR